MPKFYFDGTGKCMMCEIQNPTGIGNTSGWTGINATVPLQGGELGYTDLNKIFNIGGVVKGRNDVTLKLEPGNVMHQVKITVLSAEYFPVKIVYWDKYISPTVLSIPNASPVYIITNYNTRTYASTDEQYNRVYRGYEVYPCVYQCDSCDGSCFIAGSMVLMADHSFKPIETLTIGDKIIGKDGTINTVKFRYEAILGNKRSMFTFKDKSLFWSGEHPMWIRTLEGEEYFGIYDYNQYAREKNEILINPHTGEKVVHQGLTKKDPIIITTPVFFRTTDGWKLDDAFIDRSFHENTKIYSLYTDGNHTMHVNGYLVSAFATDVDYNYR